MYKVVKWDIVRHGVDYADYFPGYSAVFTDYDSCITESGETEIACLANLFDMLADSHKLEVEPDIISESLQRYPDIANSIDIDQWLEEEELNPDSEYRPQWYVSLLYTLEQVKPVKIKGVKITQPRWQL